MVFAACLVGMNSFRVFHFCQIALCFVFVQFEKQQKNAPEPAMSGQGQRNNESGETGVHRRAFAAMDAVIRACDGAAEFS
jgi:hypothetical protein